MPVNVAELQGKSSDELIALVESQDKTIVKLEEGGTAPAEKPAEKPAETPAATPAEKPAEAPATDAAKAEGEKQLSEVKTECKTLKEESESQRKTIKELTEKNRKSDIDTKLSEYSNKGLPTPVIDKMREVMLADSGETTIELSEKKEDGTVEKKTISLADAVCAVVDAFPTITLGERTVIHSDGRSDTAPADANKDADLQVVKNYAKENKCTFREAQDKLFSEKKIKVRGY